MKNNLYLRIALVSAIFTAFGGALGYFCKVENFKEQNFLAPITAFITSLIIPVLFINYFKKKINGKIKALIIIIGMFSIVSMLLYFKFFIDYSFEYPDSYFSNKKYLKGNVLTKGAEMYLKLYGDVSDKELVQNFGGVDEMENVWTSSSMKNVKIICFTLYTLFIIFLSSLTFCYLELIRISSPKI